MQSNLCITGLRSVGKTAVATAVGRTAGMPVYDTDEMADRCLTERGSSFIGEMKRQRYGDIYAAILSELPIALNQPGGSVISAAWGCFEHPDLAQLLRARSFVISLLPAADAETAAEILFARERSRPHFGYLDDNGLAELCGRDAARAMKLLASHCHISLVVGLSDVETVRRQVISAVWP